MVARSMARGRRLRDAVARYGRWLTVIRAQRPALLTSYPLLFGATVPLALLAGLTAVFTDGLAAQLASLLIGTLSQVKHGVGYTTNDGCH